MSASASQSKTDSQTSTDSSQNTLSLQGATGDQSPTVASESGNITFNDAGGEVSLAALGAVKDVVITALEKQATTAGRTVDTAVSSADRNSEILSSVLAANSTLAENKQTGTDTTTTRLLIYGLAGLAAIALGILFFKKS